MSCEDRYDLRITDADGESHGLICDWSKGGAGLTIKRTEAGRSTAVSTKGDFGVRDVEDHHRIIQTDWSEGQGQKTYDREIDSESAFDESFNINIDVDGELRLGPLNRTVTDSDRGDGLVTLPVLIALGESSNMPLVWGAFTASNSAMRIRKTIQGTTWTNLSGPGPASDVTQMCSDGRYIYAVAGGVVYRGDAGGFSASAHSSNTGFTHVAYAGGYLYAAKGSATSFAQLGTFDSGTWDSAPTGTAAWTAMTPEYGAAINAQGTTFGLVADGNYVYWGISNNHVTKIYKALFASGATDLVFHEVCTFPTGFVGLCMHAYLGTVYVGGGWRGIYSTYGMGSIYAIVNDTPALLTDVGTEMYRDQRVISMVAHERSLYFAADSQIWRWDLVKGGYSHHGGPLNSTPVTPYASISWTGTWSCGAAPGSGDEPDLETGSPTTAGTTSVAYSSGTLIVTLDNEGYSWRRWDSNNNSAGAYTNGIDDEVGTTMEVDLPSYFVQGSVPHGGVLPAGLCFGIQGSANSAFVKIEDAPLVVGGYQVGLYDGNTRTDGVLVASGVIPKSVVGTVRLTTFSKPFTYGGETVDRVWAVVRFNGEYICSGYCESTPDLAKVIWFQAFKTNVIDTLTDVTVTVREVRWSDDAAYASDNITVPAVEGVQLAVAGNYLYAACSGYGYTYTTRSKYQTTAEGETAPFLRSSRSAGNMPTVDKWFTAIHVSHKVLPGNCAIGCTAIIDDQRRPLTRDEDTSSDTLSVFPIGVSGGNIQWELSKPSTSVLQTPIVTEVAVLFDPQPKTSKVYTYFVRCWENVESRSPGQDWGETASIVADFLEDIANTVVQVERPGGRSYSGRVDGLEMIEAPPSGKTDGREGLYQLDIRRLV